VLVGLWDCQTIRLPGQGLTKDLQSAIGRSSTGSDGIVVRNQGCPPTVCAMINEPASCQHFLNCVSRSRSNKALGRELDDRIGLNGVLLDRKL
jgi:hypothetical protein